MDTNRNAILLIVGASIARYQRPDMRLRTALFRSVVARHPRKSRSVSPEVKRDLECAILLLTNARDELTPACVRDIKELVGDDARRVIRRVLDTPRERSWEPPPPELP